MANFLLFFFTFTLLAAEFCQGPTNTSGCRIGQVLVNGQCLSLAAPGDICQASAQCLDSSMCINSICRCTDPRTMFESGYCLILPYMSGCPITQARVNGQCVGLSIPDQQCQASSQCVGGSTCLNNVCTCPSGSTSMNGYCVPS